MTVTINDIHIPSLLRYMDYFAVESYSCCFYYGLGLNNSLQNTCRFCKNDFFKSNVSWEKIKDKKDKINIASEYQLDQLGLFAQWKNFPSLSKKSLLVHIITFFADNHYSVRLWWNILIAYITLTFSVKPFVVFFWLPGFVWIKSSPDFSQQWFSIFPDL